MAVKIKQQNGVKDAVKFLPARRNPNRLLSFLVNLLYSATRRIVFSSVSMKRTGNAWQGTMLRYPLLVTDGSFLTLRTQKNIVRIAVRRDGEPSTIENPGERRVLHVCCNADPSEFEFPRPDGAARH